jgi:hypothetical protein
MKRRLRSIFMVESYIKTVEEHHRDWDARLLTFLLAYRASTHDTTGLTLASLVFGKEIRLPLRAAVWGTPRKGTANNRSRGKFNGPYTRHPQLYPPTPEAGQWPDANSLRRTGQLLGLPRGRQRVALSPNPYEGEIAQAPILMGGPIQGINPDKRYGIQDP